MATDLSNEAEAVLEWAYERGGEGPLVHSFAAAHEAQRAGLIEVVTLGLDEPLVVLTLAGLKYCQRSGPGPGWVRPRLLMAPR